MFGSVVDLSKITSEIGYVIDGVYASDFLGFSVSSAGDFNNDGIQDLIVGAPGYGTDLGAAYVVFGTPDGPTGADFDLTTLNGRNGFRISGPTSYDLAGFSVSGAGDFNGDGIDDVIVGAYRADGDYVGAGSSYVIFGVDGGLSRSSVSLNGLATVHSMKFEGSLPNDFSGRDVSSVGDFNGDGYDDIVIGAAGVDGAGTDAGAAYLVFGRAHASGHVSYDIDQLGSTRLTLSGAAANDSLGWSVSGAGDINGDGYDDLVVGAIGVDANGDAAGGAYVVFGSPDSLGSAMSVNFLDGKYGFTLRGQRAEDLTGVSVAAAGDVNGDGIDDLIVGAMGGGAGAFEGKAYVVYGRKGGGFPATLDLAGLTGGTGIIINGIADGDFTGYRVAGAGDINHDGFDDVIIGAIAADQGGTSSGAAYVVYGAANRSYKYFGLDSLDGENGFAMYGETSYDFAGSGVSGLGDVNGDGVDDLIVGAAEASGSASRAGRAYVIYGQAPAVPLDARDDAFALTENVTLSGDLLADNGAGADAGPIKMSVYAVNGRPGGVGETLTLASGAALRVNKDGTFSYDPTTALDRLSAGETATDTVSYALWAGEGVVDAPKTVFLGGIAASPETGATFDGAAAGDLLGRAASSAGDVNGDGIDDIILGAQRSDAAGVDAGASYVIFGKAGKDFSGLDLSTLSAADGVAILGAAVNDRSGDAVAGAGDANGDGIDDLVIGSWGADQGGDLSGGAHVVYGVKGGFGTASIALADLAPDGGFALIGASGADYAGRSVNGAGDVNGDGIDDIIVGAPAGGAGGAGAAYVVFGAAGARGPVDLGALDGTDGFALDGVAAGDGAGGRVASAGDINGDGIDDLLIGAYHAGTAKAGATYVLYGAADGSHGARVDLSALNGAAGFVLRGAAAYDGSGRGAAAAGDVNGDGYDDLIVGAQGADDSGENSGTSYLVFGGKTGASLTLSAALPADKGAVFGGPAAGAFSGRSVSGAGDVNGDGFADLLIGAHGAGDAYVVFGRSDIAQHGAVNLWTLDGTDGFVMRGTSAGAQAGFAVSGAGDVNNDGFDDLLIGAPGEARSGADAGAAYVIYGRDTFAPVAEIATATFTVTGIDDAPIAHDDAFAIDAGTTLWGAVLADNGAGADADPEGAALTVTEINGVALPADGIVTLASGATVTMRADGTFDYDPMDAPAPGAQIEDGFAYTVSDGALTARAAAVITIDGGNIVPRILSDAAFTMNEGRTDVAFLSAEDGDGETLTWAIAGGADAALFDINGKGGLSFKTAPVFAAPADQGGDGVYDVTVSVTDGIDAVEQDIAVTVQAYVPPLIGEVVRLTVGTSWQTLTFDNTYKDPVVFALSPTLNEIDAAATRFRNVGATGAEIKLQEPRRVMGEPNTSGHTDESVTLLVLEKGVHALSDGTVIQVGEVTTNKLYVRGFEDIAFAPGFEDAPAIFSQVQTYDGTDWIVSRQRRADADGFQLTMQEEQADNLYHAPEDVGWFAISGGSGTLSGIDWQAGSSAQNVNGKLTPVKFHDAFDAAPLVVATLATYAGTDPGSSRIGTVSETGFTAMVLEDRSLDLETNHGYEQVDWMAFSAEGTLRDGPAQPEMVLRTGIATVGEDKITVSFGAHFDDPVVIATLNTVNGSISALARISNVTRDGFDMRLQTTEAHDGAAPAETVSWMVVEAGSWVLADGTMIEAGTASVGATARYGFDTVTTRGASDAPAAILTQTQTERGASYVKTRMDGTTEDGFRVALEREEVMSWSKHAAETVGWVKIDQGLAFGADGAAVFAAGAARTNHGWAAVDYGDAFDFADTPAVLAGMTSYNATDAADTAIRAVDAAGFDIRVEEDRSMNEETSHASEDFNWIAIEAGQEIWGTYAL